MNLKISRSLDLLCRLQKTTSEFAKREDHLTRDMLARRYALNRKHQEIIGQIDAALIAQTDEMNANFHAENERFLAIVEARRTKAQRAQTVGLGNLTKRTNEERAKWLGGLQMKRFRLEKKQAAELEVVNAEAQEFSSALSELKTSLTALEKRTRKSFAAFGSYAQLLRWKTATTATNEDQYQLLERLQTKIEAAKKILTTFDQLLWPRVFRAVPLAALVAIILVIGGALAFAVHFGPHASVTVGIVTAVLLALACGIYFMGQGQAKPAATAVADALAEANEIYDGCIAASEASHAQERQRIQEDYETAFSDIQQQREKVGGMEAEFKKNARKKIESQLPRVIARLDEVQHRKLSRITKERSTILQKWNSEAELRRQSATENFDNEMAALTAEESSRWTELETGWKQEMTPLSHDIEAMKAATTVQFPDWNASMVDSWTPPEKFTHATRFACLDIDLSAYASTERRLVLPCASRVTIPLSLTFPDQGSLLFETSESGDSSAASVMNNIILRLLTATPPGKISFTIIDPVGLGQSFAGLMHLSDYEESLINRRIWTQREQIEERLSELGEHIEKVIQMYLRNEYANITEYNERAGSVAEKYHFLVIADFPAGFSENAARHLQSIATSGPRCGVFTLIHWDHRHPLPDGFAPYELRKNSVCLQREHGLFFLNKEQATSGAALVFDTPPDAGLAVSLITKIGKSSIDSNRVQVPFSQIAPQPSEMWCNDTTSELRIPIGRTGATKLQYLAIGKGTRQHALFAGKTGSGKSTLFHVIITNLALSCSPDQVEFYLIDFKKGVEFKCYASKRLPHARVVAIESDREFALSVLQRVDEELKRRGDLFRNLGVQDLSGYKKAGGSEPMPRSLLLIDEFQEFFVEDDTIAQTASLLFDRIVRQGRAFGIHVLLGSQSLGGAYTLARATLGQMVIRVALQCNEADAYLIMDDSNSAPRLLSRPGEGIYNDAGGAVSGNNPFQVVWLPDDERDAWLDKVREVALEKHDQHPGPIVFEGNTPADIAENTLLQSAISTLPADAPSSARCWLGAPNSIKGPTAAVFQRQSGNHLLVVGQRDEVTLSMLGIALLSLAVQHPVGSAKFVIFNSAPAGSPDDEFINSITSAIPHMVNVVRGQDIAEAMIEIAAELKARSGDAEHASKAPSVFLFINGLHRFKKLRHEDDFSFSSDDSGSNPGSQLNEVISGGSSLGIHLIVTVDTFNNVNRAISRKALSEFEMRVVFQMSANDSASLIDSPKASGLGLHRALFYNEHEGYLETFRPYSRPDRSWISTTADQLAARKI